MGAIDLIAVPVPCKTPALSEEGTITVLGALKLLRHAISLLTQQPLETLKVVAPGLGLVMAVALATHAFVPELLTVSAKRPAPELLTIGALPTLLVCTFILGYALMAILWHRHTLAQRRSPAPMGPGLFLGYMWRVLILATIQLGVSLVLLVPLTVSALSGPTPGAGPTVPSMLLGAFVMQLLMLWISLRFSLVLPAAALGRPISFMQSWRLTSTMGRTIWGVAALLALINTTLSASLNLLWAPTAGRTLAVELPIYVLEGLLIFSVLTTLYAQLIQKKRVLGI